MIAPQAVIQDVVPNGIVILDKPSGLSSNRAMAKLKRILATPKAGYLGTLDPLATGVLPIFVGKATKLISNFEGLDKAYRCTFQLGKRTDTLDSEGEVLEVRSIDGLTEKQVREAIQSFEGEIEQSVPQYSAVKVNGVAAYKLARKGLPVPERKRIVRVWDVVVEQVMLPDVTFQLTCTSGTYVRSLVESIGERLGVGAYLTGLRRLRSGGLFSLENSFSLEAIEERIAIGDTAMVRNPAEFLTDHLTLTLSPEAEQPLRDGRAFPLGEMPLGESPPRVPGERLEVRSGAKVKVVRPDGTLLAVGEVVAHGPHALSFHPTKVLI